MRLRVATYNTHSGVGLDRRYDPLRIARVIREMNADVVALQELEFHRDASMLAAIASEIGFHAVAGPTFERGDGAFGNGIVSRWPVRSTEHLDLSVARREPRRAIDVVITAPTSEFRFVATHLGLRSAERVEQAKRLVALIGKPTLPTIVAGDINDWIAPRRALRIFHAHFDASPAPATFPSRLPVFALDRIWVTSDVALIRIHAVKNATSTIASDHLPLVADIEL